MDRFVKPIKSTSSITTKSKSSTTRYHPYRSPQDLLKEKCCTPRPVGNNFISSSTGHQVPQGPEGRSTAYFQSRNLQLASQFNQRVTDNTNTLPTQPQIFRNCCVYINGYMGPLISDLELKKRLARHGAQVVANFGRKSVTHVILGPNGLAGGKIQKEMLTRKTGVKYVTVDWALDSLREGKRMIEAKYAIIRHEKQASMYEILRDKEEYVLDQRTNNSSKDGSP